MPALLGDLLPYIFSRADAFKRQLSDAVQNPMGLLAQRSGQLQDAERPLKGLLAPTDSPAYADAQNAMAAMGPGLLGMTVYHGSPHLFDKFDLSKIGTGEGAQAYGHGLYFADNPAVAKQYATDRSYVGRFMNGTADNAEWDAARIAQDAINVNGEDAATHLQQVLRARAGSKNPAQAAENQKVQDAIALIQQGKVARTSNLYKVDIPDEAIGRMLQWDLPLSQQPANVRAFVEKELAPEIAVAKQQAPGWGALSSPFDPMAEYTGADLLQMMRDNRRMSANSILNGGGPDVAATLRQAGIPGIRYLDQGSRAGGQGTYNTVLFDDSLAKILSRE